METFRPTFEDLYIPATGRGVLVGMTGSGKTTLAHLLLAPFDYVAVYDAKGLLRWKDYERFETLKEVVKSNAPRVIYAPTHSELRDDAMIDAFFQWVYFRQNTFLYVDEVYAVTERLEIPPFYHAILTRGRERGNGLLSATQRPMLIPTVIMSEAESWYIFRLAMETDRKKVEACIGLDSERIASLPKRAFFYSRADEALLSPPLTLNLGKRNIEAA
jgi:hypothetical protein